MAQKVEHICELQGTNEQFQKQEALERANQATKLAHDQMGQTKRILGATSHGMRDLNEI